METDQLEILQNKRVQVQPYVSIDYKLKNKYIKIQQQKLRKLKTIVETRTKNDKLEDDYSDASSHEESLLLKFMQSPTQRIHDSQLALQTPTPSKKPDLKWQDMS